MSSAVSENSVDSSSRTPDSRRAIEPSHPSASMSNAPREASPKSRSRSWSGQARALGQRMSLSPSFS